MNKQHYYDNESQNQNEKCCFGCLGITNVVVVFFTSKRPLDPKTPECPGIFWIFASTDVVTGWRRRTRKRARQEWAGEIF